MAEALAWAAYPRATSITCASSGTTRSTALRRTVHGERHERALRAPPLAGRHRVPDRQAGLRVVPVCGGTCAHGQPNGDDIGET